MVRVLFTIGYVCAEIVALYALLMLVGWLLVSNSPLEPKDGMLLVIAVLGIPGAIVGATIGPGRRNWLEAGRYRPIRPIAFLSQFARLLLGDTEAPLIGNRQSIDFRYSGSDLPSYDVITSLSDHLRRRGIAHTAAGAISVDDNGTSWWLEAEFGEPRLKGWVQSDDSRDRELVINAIREFLRKDLRLTLS